MRLLDGLAGHGAVLSADRKGVGAEGGLELGAEAGEEGEDFGLLERGKVKDAGDVAAGDDESVAARDGEGVGDREGVRALGEEGVGWVAEGAGGMGEFSGGGFGVVNGEVGIMTRWPLESGGR